MKKNNKKGFTLVELVIVVAVMAVLVAVAIPTVSSITQSAKNAVADTNCRTIESVLKLAEAEAAKAGDGTGTLTTAGAVETAVDGAKLGIQAATGTVSTFYYDNGSGIVTTTSPASAKGTVFTITFDANGDATVS